VIELDFCSAGIKSMGALEDLINGSGPISANALKAVTDFVHLHPAEGSKAAALLIKNKISSHEKSEQIRILEILDQLVTALDFSFHEQVNDMEFLNVFSRVLNRQDCPDEVKSKILRLSADWAAKFASASDIFANFECFHLRLISEGFDVPQAFEAPMRSDDQQLLDSFLINEAEGQDPVEFVAEVNATLSLFSDIVKLETRDISQTEALISLASNLERYSEQLGLWMEKLEDREHIRDALDLNDQVLRALQNYRVLRAG
jgi:hypothetical protein